MTLYSSLLRRNPRCSVASSYSRPSECGRPWLNSGLQHAVAVLAGQVAVLLAAPVQHEHGAVAVERRGERGGGGVRDVVRDVHQLGRVEAGQRGGEEVPGAGRRRCARSQSHGSSRPSSSGARCSCGSKE